MKIDDYGALIIMYSAISKRNIQMLFVLQGSKRHEEFPIKSTFSLIDTNGDGWLEFRDFAIYIFTLNDKVYLK